MTLTIIYYLSFFVASVISLFVLYVLSKNDFVLLRKNISLSRVFDVAFIAFAISFIPARLFFIFDTLQFDWIHPLQFFYIFKFSGLSFFGFILGMAAVLYFFFHQKKTMLRVYDIYGLSLFPLFLLSTVSVLLPSYYGYAQGVVFLLLVAIFALLIKFHNNYTLRDGSVALLVVMLVCLHTLALLFFTQSADLFFHFSFSQLLCMGLFFVAGILLLINQQIVFKRRRK